MPGLKQKIPIKPLMVGYLVVILAWSSYQANNVVYLTNGLAIVAIYVWLDLLWTYIRDRIWYVPSSAVISGLILALIGNVEFSVTLLVLMPAIAVASKQLIKLGGGEKHIFNPAAFSLLALSAAGYPAVTWWGVSWGPPVLQAVLIAGLFIWWRQSRFETAISFFTAYAGILAIFAVDLSTQIYDGTVIFFASVMLVEPLTTGFPGQKNRIIYGIIAGAVAALSSLFANFLPYDPLILGLLFGNLIISLKTK